MDGFTSLYKLVIVVLIVSSKGYILLFQCYYKTTAINVWILNALSSHESAQAKKMITTSIYNNWILVKDVIVWKAHIPCTMLLPTAVHLKFIFSLETTYFHREDRWILWHKRSRKNLLEHGHIFLSSCKGSENKYLTFLLKKRKRHTSLTKRTFYIWDSYNRSTLFFERSSKDHLLLNQRYYRRKRKLN